jgi:hypothetical protein
VIIALIALSTIAVSGALAVKVLIAGVADHLEADDIPLSLRPTFSAQLQPRRRALPPRTAFASRANATPPGQATTVRQRQAAA